MLIDIMKFTSSCESNLFEHIIERQLWVKRDCDKDMFFVPTFELALNFSFVIFSFVKWNIFLGGLSISSLEGLLFCGSFMKENRMGHSIFFGNHFLNVGDLDMLWQ
jgi:hypothetical protein